ncbi:MAG: Rab family GTPase [Thermoplasmata archaeon]
MAGIKVVQKKIILLGDGAVGKTSLIKRFVVDKFADEYIATIGSKITAKKLLISIDKEAISLRLQIWDILGQKGYSRLHYSTFRGTDGVFLVTDITRKDTLNSIGTYWIPKVQNIVGTVPYVILANKFDLMEKAEFKEKELSEFASRYNVPFYYTSAKNGENVKRAFYALGKRVIKLNLSEPPKIPKPKIIHPRLLFEGEKSENTVLIDKIIDDFCKGYGRLEDAMPVVRKQFEVAGLDPNNPTKEALLMAIEGLAKVEMGFKRKEIAEANRFKRLKWINEGKVS